MQLIKSIENKWRHIKPFLNLKGYIHMPQAVYKLKLETAEAKGYSEGLNEGVMRSSSKQ